jgi:miniconductance mechanosensitive channel
MIFLRSLWLIQESGVDESAASTPAEKIEFMSDPSGLALWWEQFTEWIKQISSGNHLALVAIVLSTAFLANFVAKRLILRALRKLVTRTKVLWDDQLVQHKVFERLSHLAPALVIYLWADLLFAENGLYEYRTQRLVMAFMVLTGGRVVAALLDAFVSIQRSNKTTDGTAIRSYVQVGKILLWLVCGILIVATIMNRDPSGLLTGLGAMMTILLLVFKDSILGFVASIQLTRDDLIRRGDWIEVPKYGADGDVMEVTLHAVKVRNWDKTIATVPTPALITGGFRNWRGMSESGGRRIKRSLSLDMASVAFLDDAMLQRLSRVEYIEEYMQQKQTELAEWNRNKKIDDSLLVNGRRLTNLGTFRAYIESYLRHHPNISDSMTFLVRQLESGPDGVPIEIYVFSEEQRWVQYEAIIGDIFDHLLAVLPEFGLRVFQNPTGQDWRDSARES